MFLGNDELALLVLPRRLTTHDAYVEEGMRLLNTETELLSKHNILHNETTETHKSNENVLYQHNGNT